MGIHAHDNLSQALSNTKYANKLGVTWLDSTIWAWEEVLEIQRQRN